MESASVRDGGQSCCSCKKSGEVIGANERHEKIAAEKIDCTSIIAQNLELIKDRLGREKK